VLPGCQWHTRNEGEEPLSWFPVPYMAHLEHAPLPEGFYLRVRLVVCQRCAKPGGSRFRFASAWPARNNSTRTPLTYKEASKAGKVKKKL